MAIQTAEYLKSKFEKGDLPNQEDFEDLIDSSINSSISGDVTFFDSVTANGPIFCNDIVIQSPDGTRYKLTVPNGGGTPVAVIY